MSLTEQQAKERWCPMVRMGQDANNRMLNELRRGSGCVGPACMMWRWAEPAPQPPGDAYVHEIGKIRVEQTGEPEPASSERRGYCGLAGKPEFPS